MDLYSETILDHSRYPHHAGSLTSPTARIAEHNPLCGDTIQLDVAFDEEGRLIDLAFNGSGCAISQAAMSLLSDDVLGKHSAEIVSLAASSALALLGVTLAPARVQCALLGFTALKKAAIMENAKRT